MSPPFRNPSLRQAVLWVASAHAVREQKARLHPEAGHRAQGHPRRPVHLAPGCVLEPGSLRCACLWAASGSHAGAARANAHTCRAGTHVTLHARHQAPHHFRRAWRTVTTGACQASCAVQLASVRGSCERNDAPPEAQHAQSASLAVPQLRSCASSWRA